MKINIVTSFNEDLYNKFGTLFVFWDHCSNSHGKENHHTITWKKDPLYTFFILWPGP